MEKYRYRKNHRYSKNIVDEGSISGGVKDDKEDLTEDNPLGKMIYDSGRYDGKKKDMKKLLLNMSIS